MDKVMEKMGLYDFLGTIVPGLWFGIILYITDCKLMNSCKLLNSLCSATQIIFLIVFSYIIGTLMQEISSWIDTEIFNTRVRTRTTYLSEKIFTGEEYKKICKWAKEMLHKNPSDINFSAEENEELFFRCKAVLESSDKMGKADRLDAAFALNRSLIVCNIFLLVFALYNIKIQNNISLQSIIIIYAIFSSFIFKRRAKRYAEMRVRTIIRQSKQLSEVSQ